MFEFASKAPGQVRQRSSIRSFLVFACFTAAILIEGFCAPLCRAADSRLDKPLPDRIDFNRDIRQILSDNCYACHGPDKNKRKADLRLDTKGGIFSHIEDHTTVVPGKPEQSELFRRVTAEDPKERMPDPKSNKRLTEREISLLKKWIEQGAPWQGHWAYLKITRPPAPQASEAGFTRNPIDNFILYRLRAAGSQHAPEADRVTLIRRLSFDLIGLPPTKAEVDAFVADSSPDAYEKVVDRLLASPHFGERMAMFWLDLVRYADTIGYHSDNPMPVFPFRDYVIRSFNENKPFDRFTEEQLGGDLMPDATMEDKIASTYNRLLQTTEEGGAQAKEYVAKYDADRVRNVSTVWLGSTMACCQCHDHKFDPFKTKDFYSMASFFADIQEPAIGSRGPGTPVPDPEHDRQLRSLDAEIADAKKKLDAAAPQLAAAQAQWEKDVVSKEIHWTVLEPSVAKVTGDSHLKNLGGGVLLDYGKPANRESYTIKAPAPSGDITGIRLEAMDDQSLPAHGPGVSPSGNFVLSRLKLTVADDGGKAEPVKLQNASSDFSQVGFAVANVIDGKENSGWAIKPAFGKTHTAVLETAAPVKATDLSTLTIVLEFRSVFAQHEIGKLRLSVTSDPKPSLSTLSPELRAALMLAPAQRTEQQKQAIAAHYKTIAPALDLMRDEVAKLESQKANLIKTLPSSLVTIAGPPRTVRILARGNWMDDSGAVVTPAVPAFLGSLHINGRRPNRLDLARWLVSQDNPLAARVVVNRFWKLYFGAGLSKDLGDLGSQGEWPTHPELLEWLAAEFLNPQDGAQPWDMKHMIRLMVTSGTYRQSSTPTPEQKEADPYNRLYARQSRFRLEAETVRDNALAISGLLVDKIGGPSVKPYQPPGYWEALNFPVRTWTDDKGENEYRRGLYTWWQRSFLQPSLLAFDAPSHEEATCERNRSNIPQQALALLDDPTYVEASRAFAEHILKQGGVGSAARINWAFGQALSRSPGPQEVGILSSLLDKQEKEYAADKASALKLLSDGDHPAAKDLDPVDLAAWTNVARVILNLHETITRS